ncbi:hypothetical protein [Pyxidicoccus xibeiensis]|uniref:hypothetical protein n=1 Tax=Pyxidicoccus xibeiensis TaxID=2906759 RepID=UPI0020A78453|nr:hypothetical protein [Pyxidicoccus xibeiensis]MCP3145305.1 hypothetical protein [Pyxidicoccus xibeiensis]
MKAWVLWVVLLAGVGPARAQVPPAARELLSHMSKGARASRTGDWVTYRFHSGGERAYYWRIAVVGDEKDKLGRDAVWVEMEAGTHPAMKAPLAQMRMLVARENEQIRFDAITRLYIGGPFDRPQEYSQEALEHVVKQQEEEKRERQKEDATPAPPSERLPTGARPTVRSGKEARLMTLAGTVTAVPVEVVMKSTVIKRMWVSREIPLLHLAKTEIPGIAHTMEVAEYGIDAKPRMVLPPPNAPKVRLEYADAVFPSLTEAEEGAPAADSPKTPEDKP